MSGRGSGRMRIARSALLLALAAAALACEPAAATFPGRNGDIVLSQRSRLEAFEPADVAARLRPAIRPPARDSGRADVGPSAPLGCLALEPRGVRRPTARESPSRSSRARRAPALWTLNPDGQRIDRVPLTTNYGDVRWAPDESALLAVRNLDPADPGPSRSAYGHLHPEWRWIRAQPPRSRRDRGRLVRGRPRGRRAARRDLGARREHVRAESRRLTYRRAERTRRAAPRQPPGDIHPARRDLDDPDRRVDARAG